MSATTYAAPARFNPWLPFAPARPVPAADGAQVRILADLQAATGERTRRAADAALGQRVQAVKAYQQRRLEASYADLLADRHHARAVRFFIGEEHGLAGREAQIAAIVPAAARSFPREVVDTLAALAAWHALTESLDTGMGRHLRAGTVTPQRYATAWRANGRADDRRRQVALMLDIGQRLDRHTRDPLLMASLRMMRGPALLAGLGDLQQFLESGFDAFAAMRGAGRLLAAIEQREGAFGAALSGVGEDAR